MVPDGRYTEKNGYGKELAPEWKAIMYFAQLQKRRGLVRIPEKIREISAIRGLFLFSKQKAFLIYNAPVAHFWI